MTQVYTLVSTLLGLQNYQATTINSNRNQKDHVYGNPAYYIKGGKRTGVSILVEAYGNDVLNSYLSRSWTLTSKPPSLDRTLSL